MDESGLSFKKCILRCDEAILCSKQEDLTWAEVVGISNADVVEYYKAKGYEAWIDSYRGVYFLGLTWKEE